VGPRAGLDTEARGKTPCPYRGSNPDLPVVQSVARHYTDWATWLIPVVVVVVGVVVVGVGGVVVVVVVLMGLEACQLLRIFAPVC
jgi:hypothetical protein